MKNDEVMGKVNNRIAVLRTLFFIAFIVIVVKLFAVSVLADHSKQDHGTVAGITHTSRPEIFDRNGVKLAVNLSTASLYTNPKKIKNKEEVALQLHQILSDLSFEYLYEKLSGARSFVWLKRHLTPGEQYLVNNLGNPYLQFKDDQRRIYPQANLFSHLLGYVDIDGNGLSGLELYIDQQNLASSLVLSVDSRVQSVLHSELQKVVTPYQAIGAAGIVLDAKNSHVIAMVSLPDFDPHHLRHLTDEQKFNRTTLGLYEFGSIVKPFTIVAALDAGVIDVNTEYNVTKPLQIGRYTIKDFHPTPTPTLNVNGILRRSSNIGMAKISLQLGEDLQKKYFYELGLFQPLMIESPGRGNPIVPKVWSNTTGVTLSYGYGVSCTLMHIAQAIACLVNGGNFHMATTVLSSPKSDQQVLQPETSHTIRKLMRAVVQGGTGRRANAKGYDVGGKTGSAEKSINGTYVKSMNVSSFVAAFPMADPQYVIAIMIDEPKPIKGAFVTGGIVAAPAMKNIINKIAPILNVLPNK